MEWINKFFKRRTIGIVEFHYDEQYMKQAPVRKRTAVIAWLPQNPDEEKVRELFNIKAGKNRTITIVNVAVKLFKNIPKV
jgi:hypothetical protein